MKNSDDNQDFKEVALMTAKILKTGTIEIHRLSAYPANHLQSLGVRYSC